MIKSRCCDVEVVAFRCPKCGRWTGRSGCFTYDTEKGKQPLSADTQSLIDLLEDLSGDE
jgi:hypothetical protein